MAEKIYRLVLFNPRDEYYQLSQEERDSQGAKISEAFEEAGGKRIIQCDSSWCSQNMPGFAVQEFPDLEAEQKFVRALLEMDVFQYSNATTYLGIRMQDE